jgi:hypothetical protein
MFEPVKVWAFCEAPEELQRLSGHGGDEDWLALAPPGYKGHYLSWAECDHFGCASVEQHELADGSVVYIGAHS